MFDEPLSSKEPNFFLQLHASLSHQLKLFLLPGDTLLLIYFFIYKYFDCKRAYFLAAIFFLHFVDSA